MQAVYPSDNMATMDEYIDRMLAAVQSVIHNILDESISEAVKEPTMDEYIDQLLAEMQTPEPVQSVVHNILDEPFLKQSRSAYSTLYFQGNTSPSPLLAKSRRGKGRP